MLADSFAGTGLALPRGTDTAGALFVETILRPWDWS